MDPPHANLSSTGKSQHEGASTSLWISCCGVVTGSLSHACLILPGTYLIYEPTTTTEFKRRDHNSVGWVKNIIENQQGVFRVIHRQVFLFVLFNY